MVSGTRGSVLSQSVGVALDGADHSVVQQPVEQGSGDHGVTEDLGPFTKSPVAGHNHGAALVAGVDELEELTLPPESGVLSPC